MVYFHPKVLKVADHGRLFKQCFPTSLSFSSFLNKTFAGKSAIIVASPQYSYKVLMRTHLPTTSTATSLLGNVQTRKGLVTSHCSSVKILEKSESFDISSEDSNSQRRKSRWAKAKWIRYCCGWVVVSLDGVDADEVEDMVSKVVLCNNEEVGVRGGSKRG